LKRVDYETLPFDRTDGGHRRYRESDVLQYQQRRARRTRRAHGALHDETKGE
jgi:DNA-binding transcriptional MerR regulator